MNPIPCTICQEDGHKAAKCPTLVDPLKPGFSGAGGGGGGHSHDDDDERACVRGGMLGACVAIVSRIRTRQWKPQYSRSVSA
jgi:hypothetical protein